MVTGLKPGAVGSVEFTDLLANGQAVGRFDGMVVFVDGPLPGERARVRLTEVKAQVRGRRGARARDDLARSRRAVLPRVRRVRRLPGAAPRLSGAAGLEAPDRRRRAGCASAALRDVAVRAPIGMDVPRAYRNKMALVVETHGAAPVFGFYRARSHDLVPIDHCPIVLEPLDAAIGGLIEAARAPETVGRVRRREARRDAGRPDARPTACSR